MIRSAATGDAAYIALLQNKQLDANESALRSQYRLTTGADSTNNYVEGYSDPKWMRIVRTGNTFVSYTSTTGTDWTPVETQTIVMSSTVLAGFAVTSIDSNNLNCAIFDNVSQPAPTRFLVYLPKLER